VKKGLIISSIVLAAALSSPVFHLLQLEKEITRWCVLITVLYCPHCSDRWAPWKSTPIELGAASVSAACAAKGPQGYSHPLQSAGNGNQRTLTAVGYHPADSQKDRQGRHRQRQAAGSTLTQRVQTVMHLQPQNYSAVHLQSGQHARAKFSRQRLQMFYHSDFRYSRIPAFQNL
jgi:hypothetical protein